MHPSFRVTGRRSAARPTLLIELMRRGWSDGDVAKVAGENVLRVMAACEHTAAMLRAQRGPSEAALDASVHQ